MSQTRKSNHSSLPTKEKKKKKPAFCKGLTFCANKTKKWSLLSCSIPSGVLPLPSSPACYSRLRPEDGMLCTAPGCASGSSPAKPRAAFPGAFLELVTCAPTAENYQLGPKCSPAPSPIPGAPKSHLFRPIWLLGRKQGFCPKALTNPVQQPQTFSSGILRNLL